jgi:PAS domain S-box-containing protein
VEAALRRGAQEFRSLANSIPQLAWMADPEGLIFWFNDMWYQYTGTTEDEMRGWGWKSVHDPERLEEVVERWTACLESRQPFEMEFPLRGADGRYRAFLTRAQPIRDDRGRVVRWFGTNTDIEELRRHQRERERLLTEAEEARKQAIELSQQLTIERDKLQLTNQSLAEASRMKSDFLATLSHEIRTPLTGIVGNCELLAKGVLDERQRECVDTITLCSDTLLAMISDVLDLAKIEAGKLEMEKAVFSPLRAIEDSMRLTQGLAVAKGLGIGLEIERALPAAVWGDETRFRQVLLNLISNAIKFTLEGTVRVKVDWSRDDDNSVVELRVGVSDTGIGIEKSAQEKLFLPFSQVDSSSNRRFEGTGLGLAISRELVKKMDGEISVVSQPGVGSTFSFVVRLPEASVQDHTPTADEPSPVERKERPLRVLLAEDNPINRKTLKMQLELQGLETECARNGEVALKALAERRYDLVLMDCHMPVLDGYETTRRLRQSPGPNQDVVVIALTASVIKGERERCLAAGMTDYLSKPIPMAVLSKTLDRWFQQSRT